MEISSATIKALGDYEFSQGINRFVVHRYAHQPYLDRFPGATMGRGACITSARKRGGNVPGLARISFALPVHVAPGMFVADLCYLRPQLPDQTYFTPRLMFRRLQIRRMQRGGVDRAHERERRAAGFAGRHELSAFGVADKQHVNDADAG